MIFYGQQYTLSGYIKDAKTGEALVGASVFIENNAMGTSTNVYGFYSITILSQSTTVRYSYIGYNQIEKSIDLNKDLRLNIELSEKQDVLDEVIIESKQSDQNTQSTQMGKIELSMDKVKTIPAFMGEVDILKTIQFLPGVSSGGEGNTGFYVRGGGPDQNLILLDEATVYNASHLFGFFSVFNADAIKNVSLIKGGMPSNYGGRLSSVLDITMKDGNYKSFQADGGIGLIASRLTLQGPIKEDTASYIISGRRTYIDVLTEPFIPDTSSFKGSGYFFYDLTAKLNWRLSDKDRLYLSSYFGRDVFTFNNQDLDFMFNVPWGNATASLRWNHLFSDKIFVNTTAVFTDYNFAFEGGSSSFNFKLASGIRDYNLKQDFTYYHSSLHNFKFGWNYTFHRFIPSSLSASSGDVEFDTQDDVKVFGNESAIYLLDEWNINESLKINLGFRLSMYQHIGPFTRYFKNPNSGVTDSTREYSNFQTIKTYFGPEPRFSARYLLPDQSSFKIGFAHNYQYIHLASISSVSLPTDLWFPSTEIVKPQIGTQYSLGYFKNFNENKYETSIELYYKDLRNLIEYKENSFPEDNLNNNVDNQLTFGNGYSFGAEFFLKKRMGNFNGWIGYTYSKTMRKFDEIDNGDWFPAKYDRRNDLSIVAQYQINDRVNVGAVFVYATGNSLSLPERRWFSLEENRIITVWSKRNQYRLDPYHRLDISVTIDSKPFKEVFNKETNKSERIEKKVVSSWNISVYNLYNRANPYFIFFDYSGDPLEGTAEFGASQVSLFPILPSITWNFKF
ncbi:MAG: TonB-dependent receptor [Crocinitomicaceae bacterium]|nr:TonB-dependent receptor [Crocinitomicaceae bacterium]|tara:strand:- start:3369 stop:5735 length:2367 start_codon:yes stop_codon:yes gene_type:complete